MASAAERMKEMRKRQRAEGLREVRLLVPDTRIADIKQRLALQVARLSPADEQDALGWIEQVSEFDEAR
jgi:hypothetical protein